MAFKNLEKLNLFDNKIENIDEVFKDPPFNNTIEELDLSFNNLKSIDALVDNKKFNKIKELNIEGNSNLDYKDKKIMELYNNYKIEYAFSTLF